VASGTPGCRKQSFGGPPGKKLMSGRDPRYFFHPLKSPGLHPGHTFVPASVETYGHLGRPIMLYLRTQSDIESVRFVAGTRGSFLASAHRELSVAVVQSQGYVYRSCVLLLAKASGRQVFPGADTPVLD
jgi:hypothetical protein